jgi:predicted dehydrogenase
LVESTPGLKLYGVVSGDEDKRGRIAADLKCRVFPSLGEALQDGAVQLVVVVTPSSTHIDLAIEAMNAGRHVVVEKVMCLNLAECDRMIEAAKKNKVMLTCFQNRRFDGDYLTVQKLLADGVLGDLRWLEVAWQGFGHWGSWRGQADMGGGKLYDLGAHLIDQVCMIIQSPVESVYCRTHHDFPETDTESEALLVITFRSGQTAVCDFSSLAAIPKPRFYVRGTNGTFIKHGLDPQEQAIIETGNIDNALEPKDLYGVFNNGKEEVTVPTVPGRWKTFYENISETLNDGKDPRVTLPQLRREIAVLDAAFTSGRTGKVVHFVNDEPAYYRGDTR